MRIANQTIEFPRFGLVHVSGKNTASQGKFNSVGAGKTSLGEAICYTLFGVPTRFSTLRECSKLEKGNLYVAVEAELRGKPLLVEVGFKTSKMSPTGEALRFTYDGCVIERARIEQTREELTRMLKVDADLGAWTVFYNSDEAQFNKLSEQDSVRLLMTALNQPPWEEYHESSKKLRMSFADALQEVKINHSAAQQHRTTAEQNMATARMALKSAETQYEEEKRRARETIKSLQDDIDRKTADIDHIKSQIQGTKNQMQSITEAKSKDYKRLEVKRLEINTALEPVFKKRDELVAERNEAEVNLKHLKRELRTLESAPRTCPTCGKPLDAVVSHTKIEEVSSAVKQAQLVLDKAANAFDDVDLNYRDLKKQQKDIQDMLADLRVDSEISQLSRQVERMEKQLDVLKSSITITERQIQKVEAGPSDKAIVEQKTIIEQWRILLDESESKIRALSEELVLAQNALQIIEYWINAFSPFGIPNMILRDVIEPLNVVSKRLSVLMTGGTIEVSFATSKQLKTGQEKPKLRINAKNHLGSVSTKGASKGEGRLNNLIVGETLSEVGRIAHKVGFKWYDEVLTSQDEAVRASILAYLKDVATRFKILLMVVDHHTEVANYADHVLVCEKIESGDDAETRFSWV